MPEPTLLGYTLETVIAEKLESVVKLALVNTRMKDFYDLWTILKHYEVKSDTLNTAIQEIFTNCNRPLKHPIAFTREFYDSKETQQRWNNFLSAMGKQQIKFEDVILAWSYRILLVDFLKGNRYINKFLLRRKHAKNHENTYTHFDRALVDNYFSSRGTNGKYLFK